MLLLDSPVVAVARSTCIVGVVTVAPGQLRQSIIGKIQDLQSFATYTIHMQCKYKRSKRNIREKERIFVARTRLGNWKIRLGMQRQSMMYYPERWNIVNFQSSENESKRRSSTVLWSDKFFYHRFYSIYRWFIYYHGFFFSLYGMYIHSKLYVIELKFALL